MCLSIACGKARGVWFDRSPNPSPEEHAMRAQLCTVLTGLSVAVGSTAQAATFVVNTTAPTYDGVCNTNCSFRDAIQAANTTPGLDDIVLQTHALYLVG